MTNPTSFDAAARDELARKAEAVRTCWLGGSPEHDVEWLKTWLPDEFAEFFAVCTPDVVLALLASVRGAEADTRAIEKAFLAGYEYAVGAEALGADVGFEARQYAARAHPPIQETDDAE